MNNNKQITESILNKMSLVQLEEFKMTGELPALKLSPLEQQYVKGAGVYDELMYAAGYVYGSITRPSGIKSCGGQMKRGRRKKSNK